MIKDIFFYYFPDGYLLLARIATRSERPAATYTTLAIFNFTTSTVIKIAR